jgi:hypothetical protein
LGSPPILIFNSASGCAKSARLCVRRQRIAMINESESEQRCPTCKIEFTSVTVEPYAGNPALSVFDFQCGTCGQKLRRVLDSWSKLPPGSPPK